MSARLRGLAQVGFFVLLLDAGAVSLHGQTVQQFSRANLGSPTLPGPISVYDDWGAYDELSDNVPLTEDLAMRELDQVLRMKKAGARFDYYVMDAFWFDPTGGYRTWKKPNWPQGPDAWIHRCQQNGIQPGLWFSTNTLVHLDAAPQWRDSLNKQGTAMSMFEGGFLPDFMDVLQYWYDRGIRMFLFDFADLTAATPQSAATLTKEEIVRRNSVALRDALETFRRRNPDVVLEAFNGFGGVMDSTYYQFPFRDPVDLSWLKVFDALYCGDPRPADVPEMDFWRSLDVYADHQVRRYQQSGIPLERIDATSFMPGKTSTIYRRAFQEWKGSLILMLAHGGWINTTFGNLELMSNDDIRWYARVQSLFLHFQSEGRIHSFGGIPGDGQTYGFGALDADGSVYVVVNPAQNVSNITLPMLASDQAALGRGRILFRDAGFQPLLTGNTVQLGPGQIAMIGYGKYASPAFDFGTQQDVVIPRTIRPIPADFHSTGQGTIEATIEAPQRGSLRLVMQQYSPDGSLRRTWAGGAPNGTNMGKIFLLRAAQGGKELPIRENYDRVIWAGLSWAVGEIPEKEYHPGQLLKLTFQSTEKDPIQLKGEVYVVEY
jgi:hypothetical protein